MPVGLRNEGLGNHGACDARKEYIASIACEAFKTAKTLLQLFDGEQYLVSVIALWLEFSGEREVPDGFLFA